MTEPTLAEIKERHERDVADCWIHPNGALAIRSADKPADNLIDRLSKDRAALLAKLERGVESLRHMRVCAICAEDDWTNCEGGHAALAVIEDAKL